VISDGSCDSEDCNETDSVRLKRVMMLKITGINYTLLYIHIENR